MNVTRWNPFREMDELLNRYVSLRGDGWPQGGSEALAGADFRPAVDIRETRDGYEIDVELPAVDPKDVKVAVRDGVLTVSGERSESRSEDTDAKVHRVERRYGRFARSFVLPEDADENAIKASARHGVLYLVVARRAREVPRAIEIEVH